jgi:predicted nucleotidyltransferase
MIALIDDNRAAIADLCQKFGVQHLAVFGSAATGVFDPATSDLDFAVEFEDYGPGIARRFMGFIAALEELVQTDVDVVTPSSITNLDFLRELNRTAVALYDSGNRTAAA